MSGKPAVAFAIPAPLIYTASNPVRSASRAIAAFGTPGSSTAPFAISSRSLLLLLIPFLSCRASLCHSERSRGLSVFFFTHFHLLHQCIIVFFRTDLPC